jgi:osmotically-inducible protein OsmY
VISENGVVYLLGAVTSEQADAAVVEAQKAFGVQKIVKVFQYTVLQPTL